MTSIDHYDNFYVNLLFDRSIYRPMCTHMGKRRSLFRRIWLPPSFYHSTMEI